MDTDPTEEVPESIESAIDSLSATMRKQALTIYEKGIIDGRLSAADAIEQDDGFVVESDKTRAESLALCGDPAPEDEADE